MVQRGLQLLEVQVEPLGNQRQIGVDVVVLFANQEAGNRRIVVDDEAVLAVEKLAARRQHRHLADAVLLGQHRGSCSRPEPAAATALPPAPASSAECRTALPST